MSASGQSRMDERALILGAGGNAAYAWEVALLAGMAQAGLDCTDADLLVGTSAGARLAVQLASGASLSELLATQLSAHPKTEPLPQVDMKRWRAAVSHAKQAGSQTQVLKRIGALSLSTPSEGAAARREAVASMLPTHTWPSRKLVIVAVEAETGTRRAFDASSGIGLLEAVLASNAVPGIYPPVAFRGRHYFDGTFYSTENSDVAAACRRVLILALRSGPSPLGVVALKESVEILRAAGAEVEVIHPDDTTENALTAVQGNVLDPAVAQPAARAGRAQGERLARQRAIQISP